MQTDMLIANDWKDLMVAFLSKLYALAIAEKRTLL